MPRLDAWEAITDDNQRVVAFLGDSTVEADGVGTGPPTARYLRDVMAKRWPMRGYGYRAPWADEWSYTTGGNAWSNSSPTDAFAVGPLEEFVLDQYVGVIYASGASKVATFTKAAWMTEDITAFKIGVVDGPSSGNFAYRIDGGAWTNVSWTWNQNNSLDQITINSPVTSTVEIRGANAAGTAVTVYLGLGIEPITTGVGAVLHDLSASAQVLILSSRAGQSPGGDGSTWMDVLQPKVTFIMFTNDMASVIYSSSAVTAALEKHATRAAPYGKVVPVMFWGQQRDTSITSGTTTSGSTAITGSTFPQVLGNFPHVGDIITGPNIPAGTTIAAIADATHATLSQAATGTGSGLTFLIKEYESNAPQQEAVYASVAAAHDSPFVDLLDRYGYYPTVEANGWMGDTSQPIGSRDTLHPNDAGVVEMVDHNFWPVLAKGTQRAYA